jgi:hypothetical protein
MDTEIFGTLVFFMYVDILRPDRDPENSKSKLVRLASMTCAYDKKEDELVRFRDMNTQIESRQIYASFEFKECVYTDHPVKRVRKI